MAKKAARLLKCEALAEMPGKPADPNAKDCRTKVVAKFDGGGDPTTGCFEKLENKNPNDCITFDDTGSAETAVDNCVASLVAAIDPPPLDQTKCGAGKKKCVSRYLAALLKCHKLAQTPGQPTDPNTKGCVDKAEAKYTGGGAPTTGCFEKLENKNPNDCQILDDAATLQGLVETCVADLVNLVSNPPATTTTTSTTTSTSTTADPFRPCSPDASGTCGGICPGGVDLCVQDAQTGECVCVEGPCRAVGGFGSCYGTCPSPATCSLCAACGGCGCIIPCNGGIYPTCNGTCPPSYACGSDGIDPGCLCIAQ